MEESFLFFTDKRETVEEEVWVDWADKKEVEERLRLGETTEKGEVVCWIENRFSSSLLSLEKAKCSDFVEGSWTRKLYLDVFFKIPYREMVVKKQTTFGDGRLKMEGAGDGV